MHVKKMNLEIENKIDSLLSQMTLEEKFDEIDPDIMAIDWSKISEPDRTYCMEHLKSRSGDAKTHNILQRYALEHTRLKIPFFIHEEALHGLFRPGCTIYPQQMLLAQTFEPQLAYEMGRGIAAEARARGIHETWNPVLDLARDPRWGRTEETFGEDTYLASEMGVQVVKGMQLDDLSRPDTVAAELKHFVGYGNPVGGLNCAPSAMGRHDIYQDAMPVFEKAFVEGKATNTMCSYNSIDGIPVVSDYDLLTETLRNKWHMPGFVRSDMLAIAMLHTAHYTAATKQEALEKATKAGVDVQLFDFSHEDFRRYYKELLENGKLSIEDLNCSVRRVLRVKYMLGLFENPFVDEKRQKEVTRCESHKHTALEIARKGICLLKNKNNLLPLSKELKNIAVIGPNADQAVLGDYTVELKDITPVTLLEEIKKKVSSDTKVTYAKGCNILSSEIKPIPKEWIVPTKLENHDFSAQPMGFTAQYFNNHDFSGSPALIRVDAQINFNWIFSKPDDCIDNNCFCVRWIGKMKVPKTFSGRIGLSSSDSMRLFIDGDLIIDGWGENDANQMAAFLFEAEKEYSIRVEFLNDCRGARVIFGYDDGEEDITRAVQLVKEADVAVVAMGDSNETSGENFDRTSLDLPGNQLALLKQLHATGTPIVLVLYTGRSISAVWEQENIPAILQAGFPGVLGARAAAEILFGEINPSGRLALSYPRTVGQLPCHYSRKPAGGKRYVEMDWNPLYPFGYGLSYTSFSYSNLTLSSTSIYSGETITVSFDITNTGNRYGEEVAQVYVNDCFSSVVKPIKELKAFQKVGLAPKETKTISLELGFEAMRTLTKDYKWIVESGEFEVIVGDNAMSELLKEKFVVR